MGRLPISRGASLYMGTLTIYGATPQICGASPYMGGLPMKTPHVWVKCLVGVGVPTIHVGGSSWGIRQQLVNKAEDSKGLT